jgi:uncharacterized protein (TIGR03437 family)
VRILFFALFPLGLLPDPLWAQAPFISSVSNDATSDAHFSPGSIVRFNGTSLPPQFSVALNGKSAAQLPSGTTIVARFQLPVDAPTGPATLTANLGGSRTQQFNIALDPYAPSIYEVSPFYPVHSGDPHTICSLTPAAPGDFVTALVTGLGATIPPVATGATGPTPAARTIVTPFVTIDGQAVDVIDSVLAPDDIGKYLVRFRAPTTTGLHSVRIAAGNAFGNETFLPINAGRLDANFSATTFLVGRVAPESLMTAYSCSLAGISDGTTPPVISITDSRLIERPARLSYFSKFQANYAIPPGTAIGIATVNLKTSSGEISTAKLDIEPVGPGLFGGVLVVRSDSIKALTVGIDVAEGVGGGATQAVDLSGDDDVYLVLFGTGIRFRTSLENVHVSIAGIDIPVKYAGAQNQFEGLDQVNLLLPKSLRGIGAATLVLTVDGFAANAMHLLF